MHYCYQFSRCPFLWTVYSYPCPHCFTKLLVYFLLVCGRFSLRANLLSAALGKHATSLLTYFTAILRTKHRGQPGPPCLRNIKSSQVLSGKHSQRYLGGVPPESSSNPRAAHPNSSFCDDGNVHFYCRTQKPHVTCGNWAPIMVACVTKTELLIF